jgi:hypothetical protein
MNNLGRETEITLLLFSRLGFPNLSKINSAQQMKILKNHGKK